MQAASNNPTSGLISAFGVQPVIPHVSVSMAFLEVLEWYKTAQDLQLDSLPQVESSVKSIAAGLIGFGC